MRCNHNALAVLVCKQNVVVLDKLYSRIWSSACICNADRSVSAGYSVICIRYLVAVGNIVLYRIIEICVSILIGLFKTIPCGSPVVVCTECLGLVFLEADTRTAYLVNVAVCNSDHKLFGFTLLEGVGSVRKT